MSFYDVLLKVFKDNGVINSECIIHGAEVLEKIRRGANPCEECDKKKECRKEK